MKVIFCIPTHSGSIESECHSSLVTLYAILREKGIQYDEFIVKGCPYIQVARNNLVAMFMNDPDATDLFFIDSDVGFDPLGALKILERDEGIVSGIYPLKRDLGDYPVKIKMIDNTPIGLNGLIEAELLPTGFMRIKRNVIQTMYNTYPELKYEISHINIDIDIKYAYDLFTIGVQKGVLVPEDYAFCRKWTHIGGQLWVHPDIEFSHIGRKQYKGNYHKYLISKSVKNIKKKLEHELKELV